MKNQYQRLTVAIAFACAGGASASPIFFSNPPPGDPGHFDWTALTNLNITMPASQQTGAIGGLNNIGTFQFHIDETFDEFTGTLTRNGIISAGFGGLVNQGAGGLLFSSPGDLIGPGGVVPNGGGGGVYVDLFVGGVFSGGTVAAPLGESFLGVSFVEIDSQLNILGNHFGWIGFNLFENPDGSHGLDVTRYGYETTIDTAITVGAIPAPSAAPLFAAAAALLTTRRRRKD